MKNIFTMYLFSIGELYSDSSSLMCFENLCVVKCDNYSIQMRTWLFWINVHQQQYTVISYILSTDKLNKRKRSGRIAA
jgi:hypothetical protein